MGHCCFPAEPSRLLTQQRQKATHAGDSLAITSQVVSCGTPTGPDLILEGLDSPQGSVSSSSCVTLGGGFLFLT